MSKRDASCGPGSITLVGLGGSIRAGAGWAAAIRSYNHSDTYVQAVFDAASAYAARTVPR